MPVNELKSRITYSEFLEWIEFINREEARRTKQDIYLAQVATEVRRSYVAEPKKVHLDDFLLRSPEQKDRQKKMKQSKTAWGMALGVKIEE